MNGDTPLIKPLGRIREHELDSIAQIIHINDFAKYLTRVFVVALRNKIFIILSDVLLDEQLHIIVEFDLLICLLLVTSWLVAIDQVLFRVMRVVLVSLIRPSRGRHWWLPIEYTGLIVNGGHVTAFQLVSMFYNILWCSISFYISHGLVQTIVVLIWNSIFAWAFIWISLLTFEICQLRNILVILFCECLIKIYWLWDFIFELFFARVKNTTLLIQKLVKLDKCKLWILPVILITSCLSFEWAGKDSLLSISLFLLI